MQTGQKTFQVDKTTLLHTMVETFNSYSNPKERLSSLLVTLVQGIGAQLACIYEYQRERECLVLTECSNRFLMPAPDIEVSPGEGFTGWTALTRKTLTITQDAPADPRFLASTMIEATHLQAVMVVPIETAERQLLGVLSIQFPDSMLFTPQHETLRQTAATLLALALEQAQLQRNMQRHLSIQTALLTLGQISGTGKSMSEILHALANQTLQIMQTDLCTIVLQDPESGEPTLQAISPRFNEFTREAAPLENVNASGLLRLPGHGEMPSPTSLGSQFQTLLSLPLVLGTEVLGQVNCYSRVPGQFGITEQNLLKIIANQLALILKNLHYQAILHQHNQVPDFFQRLQTENREAEEELRQQAEYLGCNLGKPHIVAIIELAHNHQIPHTQGKDYDETSEQEFQRLGGLLQRRIQSNYPGSLTHCVENRVTCLILVSKDPTGVHLRNWLRELAEEFLGEHNTIISAGIGNICQKLEEYRNGFAEASEALQVGGKLELKDRVTHFNDLGVYRYLYKITRMDGLRDIYQDQVTHIAVYDQRKGTDLLDTLEIYLEFAGNLTKTSNHLFVHRNTLIQRLERLQSLCDVNLQDRSNWLTLQVAIKVFRLRNTIHKM